MHSGQYARPVQVHIGYGSVNLNALVALPQVKVGDAVVGIRVLARYGRIGYISLAQAQTGALRCQLAERAGQRDILGRCQSRNGQQRGSS
ncbi:hypothetical protein GCM10022408_28700 [Hymenobacter fastidiosus]|uniref:Uncharacterized protein n=1 Tax=Hymenobacter fastidiosus TaxID=486264 RepID=A0ABP7SMG6_9BACT